MDTLAATALALAALGVLLLPRRGAVLALLAGGCYLPMGLELHLGAFNFYALRLLLLLGFVRVLLRGSGPAQAFNRLDWAVGIWAFLALASAPFHENAANVFVNRLGMVYTAGGTYLVLRHLCRDAGDVAALCRSVTLVLVPVAIEMLYERRTGENLFALIGGVDTLSEVRNGTIRAQGPFAHSILAGSVGAAALPLAIALWNTHWKTAAVGTAGCLAMVYTSGSSGPLMGATFAVLALFAWSLRGHMRLLRWAAVCAYIGMDIVMNAPAYYLLARIDLTGSSTSWHRAALIESAIAHLPEWWFAGTDTTRHWMPYGVPWSDSHVDITNHYLRMGVDGGLPLLLAFVFLLVAAFSRVGRALIPSIGTAHPAPFLVWALGSSLFAHAANFMAVSYFDQSVAFLHLTLAAIGSTWVSPSTAVTMDSRPVGMATPIGSAPTHQRETP